MKLKLYDSDHQWSSRTVRAIVALNLCADVILGLPFLAANDLIIDPAKCSVADKKSGFDLLNPAKPSLINTKTVPLPTLKTRHNNCSVAAALYSNLPFHSLPSHATAANVLSGHHYELLRDADLICAV